MNKKTERFLKRIAREERRYGEPVLLKIAEEDPSVGRHYDRYKMTKKQGRFNLIMTAIFLTLGMVDLIMLIITGENGWGYSFGIQTLLAIFWLDDYKLSSLSGEWAAFKIIYYADYEAKTKAYESVKGQKDGDDKAKKVD